MNVDARLSGLAQGKKKADQDIESWSAVSDAVDRMPRPVPFLFGAYVFQPEPNFDFRSPFRPFTAPLLFQHDLT